MATSDHLEVLRFWFGEPPGEPRKQWFEKDAAFDAEIRQRFLALHERLAGGAHLDWLEDAQRCLARIVVLDQFPRNMFRGTPRAFATDALALAAARHAVAQGHDRDLLPVQKQFVYLPFEHSESLADQERACELMRPLGEELYDWALRHKRVIERFGRFPHRNAILGRESTPDEVAFLKQPGSSF